MKPTLLIMAAGMGSRYGSLKQIDPVGPSGEAIVDYSVYDAIRSDFGRVVFVIRRNIEKDFRESLLKRFEKVVDTAYVFQELDTLPDKYACPANREKPWGTGHAILMAAEAIETPFAAINADDFYGYSAFRAMSEYLSASSRNDEYAMISYALKNTLSEHGSVSRGVCKLNESGFLQEINEKTSIRKKQNKIVYEQDGKKYELNGDTPVSMNFWGFTPLVFQKLEAGFSGFLKEHITDPGSEYYIPSFVDEMIRSSVARVKVIQSDSRWFGVTYREDREIVRQAISNLVSKDLYPPNLWK
jgi:UTP-glucose-1-phosphate uridylyltransferase